MELDNIIFDDYPIEFKEVNPEDFNGFQVGSKITISPNEQGYINDSIQSSLNLDEKNTVVINASVGQGKSYALIQVVKQYYNKIKDGQDYLIFVASPFVSLVKQYYDDITTETGATAEKVFNYEELGQEGASNYLEKPIQIVTVNTLLGNPGDDGFKNSEVKRDYINLLSEQCVRSGTKVVFIYDEIHDSYHNFNQKYIFNLWKWKKVIHKNFIVSATYNEASKVVIEYLGELTDKKIKIIESERKIFKEKQSKLFLHYSNDKYYTSETKEIKNLIDKLLSNGRKIDVLCYSKKLANEISSRRGSLGKLIRDAYGSDAVTNCTSQLVYDSREENTVQRNQYDNEKCNIGTNFKTGVNIKKTNHAFVIIMPPNGAELQFKNLYGIFSGGINSVIQAIARQRYVEGGENNQIHIVLPSPKKFNYESLSYSNMNEVQKLGFKNIYSSLSSDDSKSKLVSYFNLNIQNRLLNEFYEGVLKAYLEKEIEEVQQADRSGLASLNYPDFKTFVLENGESYLSNNYPIYGEDLSSYVTYASITNQFINCRLEGVFTIDSLCFSEESLNEELDAFYIKHNIEERFALYTDYGSFNSFCNALIEYLFNGNDLLFKLKRKEKEEKEKKGEGYSRSKRSLNVLRIKLIPYFMQWYGYGVGSSYTRGDYLLDCIKVVNTIEVSSEATDEFRNRIKLFKAISYFKDRLNSNVGYYNSRGREYCYLRVDLKFSCLADDYVNLEIIEENIQYDDYLNKEVFKFKSLLASGTHEKKIKSIYKILKEDFYLIEDVPSDRVPTIKIGEESRVRVNVIRGQKRVCRPIDFFTKKIDWSSIEQSNVDFVGEEANKIMKEEISDVINNINNY